MVFHDKDLTRMTKSTCTSPVASLNFAELPLLIGQCERTIDIKDKSSWQRIPELKDVFEAINPSSGVNFIIEFKQDSNELIQKVRALMTQYGHVDNVFWFSLQDGINRKLWAMDPSVSKMSSIAGMLKVLGLYYIGLLPFVDIEFDVLGLTIDEVCSC